jgi:hypothetical protein
LKIIKKGVQVLIAHRNARLLKAHFDYYRLIRTVEIFLFLEESFEFYFKLFRHNYTQKSWYYNAGHVPAIILRDYSFLARIVKIRLGTQNFVDHLFKMDWNGWRDLNSVHLMINHRYYLDKDSPIKEFNETNIWTYNRTYGVMVRTILRRANLFLPLNNTETIIDPTE